MAESRPTVQVLFPMGGLGTRFAEIGIQTPKPLIEVEPGVPMIQKALGSFDGLRQKLNLRTIFVVRTEHDEKHHLCDLLRTCVPSAEFAMLAHDTRGAVETCLVAKDCIDKTMPIVVMDCDLYFRSAAYDEAMTRMAELAAAGQASELEGLLLYFSSTAPRYSYADCDPITNLVLRTAEKQPISNRALIGAYGFGSGKIFLDAANALMMLPIDPAKGRKEYYLSLLYNFVIEHSLGRARADDGTAVGPARILAVPRDEYHSFGTPEELEKFRKGEPSHVEE